MSKYGEKCDINANCISTGPDGKAIPGAKAPLVCSNNKCTYGVFGDACDYADVSPAGDTGECGYGFTCGSAAIPDQCVLGKDMGGFQQRCDVGKGADCRPEFSCQEVDTWNEDDSNNPLGCHDDDTGGEVIDIYMCYPKYATYGGFTSKPTMCWCNEESDCAGTGTPYCVKDLSNDDQTGTKDSFCSTGEPGVPCKDGGDCISGECYAKTCYVTGNYFDPTGPADGMNIGKYPKLNPPQSLINFYGMDQGKL